MHLKLLVDVYGNALSPLYNGSIRIAMRDLAQACPHFARILWLEGAL